MGGGWREARAVVISYDLILCWAVLRAATCNALIVTVLLEQQYPQQQLKQQQLLQ